MTNSKLEDKARYENETGQKLPEKILAYCDICQKEIEFVYAFIQSGFSIMRNIPIYNCAGCKGTKSYKSLINNSKGRNADSTHLSQ